MSNQTVPFVDLVSIHQPLREELLQVFLHALDTAEFVGGSSVKEFEQHFAAFCEARCCVGVGSGTDALRFALVAAGVKPGETVVTVPLTFIATAATISQVGARPEFVDIDPRTYTMDADNLRVYLETECTRDPRAKRLLSKRTGNPVTAVIPVHLYGQMADMDPILELASQYNLMVIEDACQAHGAEYFSKQQQRWCKAGSMGHAAAFSFYPGKNLGACGEGGSITTHDEQFAQHCLMLRDHGQSRKYHHDIEGYNGRLDAIQAGILSAKLRHLAQWNEQRRDCARRYDEWLADVEDSLVLPHVPSWSRPVFHLYVIRVADRDRVQQELAAAGIGTGIHYPIPLHLASAYQSLGYQRGDFAISEQVAAEILSLPMFPGLSAAQQRVVVETLRAVTVLEHADHASAPMVTAP